MDRKNQNIKSLNINETRKRLTNKKNSINNTNNTNSTNNIKNIKSVKRNYAYKPYNAENRLNNRTNRASDKYEDRQSLYIDKYNNRNYNISYPNRDGRYNTLNNVKNSYKQDYYNGQNIKNKKIYRAKKKTKNRNIAIISRLFTFMMFFIIISYFSVSVLKSMNKKPIDYETIEYGSIEDINQAKGIIIRDEDVYKASKNGIVVFNKGLNEKVKKGETVATIKNQDAIKTDEQDIKNINQKILQLQEERNELSIFYEDVKKMDLQIQKVLDNAINELSIYNVSKIYEIKENLNKKLNIRNQMLLSENSGSVQDLLDKKADKEQNVNKGIENIASKTSGILSYYTDGLEQNFNFKTKDTLTKEQTLMQAEDSQDYNFNILQGEPVFKIVKDNNFYIASYIPNKNVSSWVKGETREIYINDAGKKRPLEVIIEKIEKGEKESYVLMKSNKNIIDFIEKRTVFFDLSKQQEGFKIKTSAISEEELLKIPTDYIVDNKITKKGDEPIKVTIQSSGQDETGQYTYVKIAPSMIDIGDYVIHPKTQQELELNDIFTRKGIYVVNSGIYNFKSIATEGSVQNDEFIILNPNKNKNIKLYDRYAPDLSVVKGEEIIKKWQTKILYAKT